MIKSIDKDENKYLKKMSLEKKNLISMDKYFETYDDKNIYNYIPIVYKYNIGFTESITLSSIKTTYRLCIQSKLWMNRYIDVLKNVGNIVTKLIYLDIFNLCYKIDLIWSKTDWMIIIWHDKNHMMGAYIIKYLYDLMISIKFLSPMEELYEYKNATNLSCIRNMIKHTQNTYLSKKRFIPIHDVIPYMYIKMKYRFISSIVI